MMLGCSSYFKRALRTAKFSISSCIFWDPETWSFFCLPYFLLIDDFYGERRLVVPKNGLPDFGKGAPASLPTYSPRVSWKIYDSWISEVCMKSEIIYCYNIEWEPHWSLWKTPLVSKNTPTRKRRTNPIATIWRIVLLGQSDFIAQDDITEDRAGFFAILDGHGGKDVSEYCATHLPEVPPLKHRFLSRSMPNNQKILSCFSPRFATESTKNSKKSTLQKEELLAALYWSEKRGTKGSAPLEI